MNCQSFLKKTSLQEHVRRTTTMAEQLLHFSQIITEYQN